MGIANSTIQTKYLKEVEQRIKNTGTTIPEHRAAHKQGYSLSKLPVNEQLPFWDVVWNTSVLSRVRLQAFFYAESVVGKPANAELIWAICKPWQDRVQSWDHCDCLAKIYTKLLESGCRKDVFAVLAEWNSSPDLWKRRQSVVSLLYFHRTKKQYEPFDTMAKLVKNLLADTEYYVHLGRCIRFTRKRLQNSCVKTC